MCLELIIEESLLENRENVKETEIKNQIFTIEDYNAEKHLKPQKIKSKQLEYDCHKLVG